MSGSDIKKAFAIGGVSIFTYMISYYLRNLLSVLTPQMLETGEYTVGQIGVLSSVYMVLYAAGQLVNGFLGDRISPKWLVVGGMVVSGGVCILFPLLSSTVLQVFCFVLMGFGLSMLRGPLMKIISENTKPGYARMICVLFSASCYVGSFVAGLVALVGYWKLAFILTGVATVAVAVLAFVSITVMERKKVVSYQSTKGQGWGALLGVFKIPGFLFYLAVACLSEIGITSITFWIPTFLDEYLQLSEGVVSVVYSGIVVMRALVPFATLAVFKLFKEREMRMMRVCFALCLLAFGGLLVLKSAILGIALLALGLIGITCVSSLLWSIYIPSLGKTGMVSSANGVLDCAGYATASVVNLASAAVMGAFGWNAVFIIWAASGLLGVGLTFLRKDDKPIAPPLTKQKNKL